MLAYRLTHVRFAEDLSGFGAYKTGGRWNPRGYYTMYLSEHPAGAILEALIHMPPQVIPDDYVMVTCRIDDNAPLIKIEENELPLQWREDKYSLSFFQSFGKSRLFDAGFLGMIIPSLVAYPSDNYVLNCVHKEFRSLVKILEVKSYIFDPRLIQIFKNI